MYLSKKVEALSNFPNCSRASALYSKLCMSLLELRGDNSSWFDLNLFLCCPELDIANDWLPWALCCEWLPWTLCCDWLSWTLCCDWLPWALFCNWLPWTLFTDWLPRILFCDWSIWIVLICELSDDWSCDWLPW